MNQKTLLAIILSIMVLFGYEAIFVAPKRAQMLKESKSITEKELTQNKEILTQVTDAVQEKTKNKQFEGKIWEIKTPSFVSHVTNEGGALHNIKVGAGHAFPLNQIITIKGISESEFKLVSQNADKTVLSYQDDKKRVLKTYEVKDRNTILARVDINSKEMSSLDNVQFQIFRVDNSLIDSNDKRDMGLEEYSVSANKKIFRKNNISKFNPKENKIESIDIDWAGFRNHFSTIVIHPDFATKAYEINTVTEKQLSIYVTPASQSTSYEFTCYIGPQDPALMKKYEKGIENIFAFFNWNVLDIFAKAIYFTIPFLHSIFKSWGFSIILISLIIYGLTYPLTFKSMMSMRKMQQVQPKIKALQDRFKNDPQKLNTEIMDIYKKEKINPLGGCLPFLLQMPIFVALYQVLWRSYYFQGESFLWIKDLALPDRLFIMPFSLPLLGNEFNILPLLMAAVMFLQQKISSKNLVVTDEQQAMQQKMMLYLFPIFIGFIFYKFASGLSLYFTVFYALSAATQWKMSKIK